MDTIIEKKETNMNLYIFRVGVLKLFKSEFEV